MIAAVSAGRHVIGHSLLVQQLLRGTLLRHSAFSFTVCYVTSVIDSIVQQRFIWCIR